MRGVGAFRKHQEEISRKQDAREGGRWMGETQLYFQTLVDKQNI